MTERNSPQEVDIQGWPFLIRRPLNPQKPGRILLLLHGHLGNEAAMWILTKPLPKSYILLSPRAPFRQGKDQYSWHDIQPQWPGLDTYGKIADQLISRVDHWVREHQLNATKYDLMGFSQGAVLAYALSLLNPDRIGKVAALAGFLPQSWQQALGSPELSDRRFFIAHGTRDEVVPIEKARQTAGWLKENGAQVAFCEADTGHKLSANCFSGLGEYFTNDR